MPAWFALLFLIAASGCSLSGKSSGGTSDSGFGNREDDGDDGRATIVITSVPNAADYVVAPAPFETVDVRTGAVSSDGAPIELLIKGAFPDSCTELHGTNQTRSGDELIVQLQARRPGNAMCATVMRPYRFYMTIEGAFTTGRYTLDLNGVRQVFEIN